MREAPAAATAPAEAVVEQARRQNRIGIVGEDFLDDALDLARQHKESLDGVINRDVPVTRFDTPLVDLLPLATSTALPIPVLGEEEKLLGVVSRAAILSGLMQGNGEEENAHAL